jgi:hypothetical protein
MSILYPAFVRLTPPFQLVFVDPQLFGGFGSFFRPSRYASALLQLLEQARRLCDIFA